MGEEDDLVEPETGFEDDLAPLGIGVVAHVRRVPQALCLLDLVAHVHRVDDQHARARHAGQLSRRRAHVGEMVRRGAAGDDVEARIREREMLGRTDDIRTHPGRRVRRDDLDPRLPQPTGDVPPAGRHVERGPGAPGPFDQPVEVLRPRRCASEST